MAAVLRIAGVWGMPFMHDEFSALFRLNFNSLSELIEKGVMPDGHPAGVQVFLYFWSKVFGTSEMALKFPSLILGLASVALIFKIGSRIFNTQSAIFAATLAATTQFYIFYSHLARPYI